MTNTGLLRDIIRASGLKQGFIAEQIGISRQSFYRFLHGEMELRQSQIAALCEILSLSKADKERIFFAQQKE